MRSTLLICALMCSAPAWASPDPVADTRTILAGTVTPGGKAYKDYLAGRKDGTAAFQGALKAYKAVRAAEVPVPPPVVVTPPPVTTPPPAAPVLTGEFVLSPTLTGLVPPTLNYTAQQAVVASYMPGSNAADMVGAFRFMCKPGHHNRDDTLLYHGQRGVAHPHLNYGNTLNNADSTGDSLRQTGGSTCGEPDNPFPANRSAYWTPDLLDENGNAVNPGTIDIYYKRWPKTSTDCSSGLRTAGCVDIPFGMRFVWGYDVPKGQPAQYPWGFYCGVTPGNFTTLAEAVAGGRCPVGSYVYARSDAPSCWDGKNLDTPDHRSHVAYMEDSHEGYNRCPKTHPYHMPALTVSIGYKIMEGDNPALWTYSSDHGKPAGTTMHGDYWEAWHPDVKAMWEANCIDKMLNCVGGALGNGYSIPGADTSRVKDASGALVDPQHLVKLP